MADTEILMQQDIIAKSDLDRYDEIFSAKTKRIGTSDKYTKEFEKLRPNLIKSHLSKKH